MRTHRLICIVVVSACVLITVSRTSWADHITELVVFGDSLSDAGNVFGLTGGTWLAPPYWEGRASNGPVWVEQLASRLGVPIPTASRTGGTNFAYGGAQTGSGTWYDPNADANIPNVALQIDEFLARGQPLRDDQLVVLWAGANDILNSGRDPALVVSNLTEHVRALHAAGGANFLTPNLWQIDDRFRAYNQLWADELNALRQTLPISVTWLDIPGVTQKVFANPGSYGIRQVQGQAYNDRTGRVGPNPNEYLVWDRFGHPTEALHGIIADAAYDLLVSDPRHATPDEIRLVARKPQLTKRVTLAHGMARFHSGHCSFSFHQNLTSCQQLIA